VEKLYSLSLWGKYITRGCGKVIESITVVKMYNTALWEETLTKPYRKFIQGTTEGIDRTENLFCKKYSHNSWNEPKL